VTMVFEEIPLREISYFISHTRLRIYSKSLAGTGLLGLSIK
jgi:hypothetical protein